MPNRQLLLISPYRLPTHSQVYLNAEEMAAWLNGYLMLWHPALLLDCPRPPSVASPYDHERPNPGQVFAVPENPTLYVPDDWGERIRAAGALRFTASPTREATRDHLKAALADPGGFATPDVTAQLLDLPDEAIADFYAVGFGYLVVDALFDAMDHDKLLDVDRFWAAVQSALVALVNGQADTTTAGLRQAAQTLQEAREVLYASPVHVLDIWLGDPARFAEQVQHLLSRDLPVNLLANATLLRGLASAHPLLGEQLRQKIGQSVEVCGGTLMEREDSLLPLESQLWNLRRGQVVSREVLGAPVRVHARRRSSWHAQSPSFLHAAGLTHALLVAFDGALLPSHRATVINWPGPDGKQVDAFCRVPFNAHEPQTFFNLVYHLRQTITQDTAPTVALQHRGEAPFVCYHDWQRLSQLAQVFGHWTTLSRYFTDALAGEYASPALPDDFAMEYLEERIAERRSDPVSAFARHARARRRLDGVWTLAGFYRALAGAAGFGEALADCEALSRVEDQLEELATTGEPALHAAMQDDLAKLETAFAQRLARRLLARATSEQPGYLLLNPCSFPRRVALELDPFPGPVPLAEPIKAAQFDPDKTRLVVEVPALGFAWFPRRPTSNVSPPRARVKTAEGNIVRNEYFEAEIDPATGGLRFLRDLRFRSKRLGQQLVYNPGSSLKVNSLSITHAGTALGEIVTTGQILDIQGAVIAQFRQRFRAWVTRPVLEIRIELTPEKPPTGYPWHAYYAARFAWPDERTAIQRASGTLATLTAHNRPVSPDFVELRLGKESTAIFTGGLPFHQRQGKRMLDVILLVEGEQTQVFDLAIAVDRENPMQTATGFTSPVVVTPTDNGPPHVGPSGWLFHLDMPNLLISTLRPTPAQDGQVRGVVAQLAECMGFGGPAELRCLRDPLRAVLLDPSNAGDRELTVTGDTVALDVVGAELQLVQIDLP